MNLLGAFGWTIVQPSWVIFGRFGLQHHPGSAQTSKKALAFV
jgi:hypothetical protein